MERTPLPMQCRNCLCYLDEEFRYCPRCGAPSSMGWPAPGSAWLRRPAAIAGLSLFVVAWLVALQRQLWSPANPSSARLPPGSRRLAGRSPTHALPPEWGNPVHSRSHSVPRAHLAPSLSTQARPRRAPHVSPALPQRLSRPVARVKEHRTAALAVAPRLQRARYLNPAPRSGRPAQNRVRYLTSAWRSEEPARAGQRHIRRQPTSERAERYMRLASRGVVSPKTVLAHAPGIGSSRGVNYGTNTTVSIAARPYRDKTLVFLNGATLLGSAPLRAKFPHPGRYHLFFFTPDLGPRGRQYRDVEVTGRGPQTLTVTVAPPGEVARAE